ncbi:MAG: hypothetical protein PHT75_03695 [Bacilli bacterium]|nr:hypothetical protein [Bacilli bacterium]MDD4054159.1 hypothetical protein [Bacilli bacterium]MDD4411925.1 hypothetical protein [Bacilli bacterium]
MNITKEVLEVEGTLQSKINNLLSFLGIKTKIIKGNIISIDNTNLAYIEPHKLKINDITYLFFNECNDVYINTLEQSISITGLENYIKTHKNDLK